MKKQFVSLNQALGYLQFINSDKQAFTDKVFKSQQITNQKRTRQNQIKRLQDFSDFDQSRKKLDGENQQSLGRKTLNKNRAIKRIIQTSKQILQTNFKYQQPPPAQKTSYITQFNIYLKQYNRLSQQILAQQQERIEQKHQSREDQQAKLQQVFKFTVSQDFRQLIEVSILKDKINKNNVNMIMDTFKQCLIVLKNNQMRVYETQDEDSNHRDIKLHEIQNVDYFSQPYIFTVMTIVKDKSSGNQFLCFKFDSSQKQHKWDRAVYCNYIVKKMKRKNRYFLSQFPEKQSEKQNIQGGMQHNPAKKREDIKSYELDKKKVIKNLANQRQKQTTRMGTGGGIDTERDLPTTEKRDKMQRFNTTDNQLTILTPTRENNNKNNLQSTKNSEPNKFFQSNLKGARKKESGQDQPQQNNQEQQNNQKPNSNKGSIVRNNSSGPNNNPNLNQTNKNNQNANTMATPGPNKNNNTNMNASTAPGTNKNNQNIYATPGQQSQGPGQNNNQNNTGNPNNTNNSNNTNQMNNNNSTPPQNKRPSQQSKKGESEGGSGNQSMSPNQNKNNTPGSQTHSQYIINPHMVQSEQQQESQSKQSSKIINPYTRRKIELKQKHQQGIMLQKVKFFIDKPKLLYLNNDELQYWDYEKQTLHKSEKKVIVFKDIKIYRVLKNKNCIIYIETKNKQIQFCGKSQDVDDIVEWIQLCKKEKQFQQSEVLKQDNKNDKKDKNKPRNIFQP